jgi:hypothetical protein
MFPEYNDVAIGLGVLQVRELEDPGENDRRNCLSAKLPLPLRGLVSALSVQTLSAEVSENGRGSCKQRAQRWDEQGLHFTRLEFFQPAVIGPSTTLERLTRGIE